MTVSSRRGGVHLGGSRRGRLFTISVVAVALAAVTGCTSSAAKTDSAATTDAGIESSTDVVAQPVLPTPTDTGPTRQAAAQLPAVPQVGTVTVEQGAFTDRLRINEVTLKQGSRPTVTAQLSNAVDVSELIVLELQADFYDRTGRFVGSGSATYADQEFADSGATPLPHGTGEHDETFDVSVRSDRPLSGVSSAILTVPQLVNE